MSALEANCHACGQPLAPKAAFCRSCGARAQPDSPASPAAAQPPQAKKSRRTLLLAAVAAVLVGAGVGGAVVLVSGGDSDGGDATTTSEETVPSSESPLTQTGEATSSSPAPEAPAKQAVDTIEAGRYVQAGSFRTVEGAETERDRLTAAGATVEVVDSDAVQDLLPGFQVLLGGPLTSSSQESQMLKRVHAEGVPSAFARNLTPAFEISGPSEVAGEWIGELERTGTDRSGLNGDIPVTMSAAPDGQTASITFDDLECEVDLSLVETTAFTLAYSQGSNCVGGGRWSFRPSGAELSATLLPPDTDVIVVGSLRRR